MPNNEVVSICELIPDIVKVDRSNIGEKKPSVLYKGGSGDGKSWNALTWPGRKLVVMYDPNDDTHAEFVRQGHDIELIYFKTWKEFKDQFCPAVKHHRLLADTIILDTADKMAEACMAEVKGTRRSITQADWGVFRQNLREVFDDLTKGCKVVKGKPSYPFICTVHEKTKGSDDGGVEMIIPKIDGSFAEEIESYFGTVLICESEKKTRIESGKVVEEGQEWFVKTVPQPKHRKAKGMGLPPRVGGTYPELMKAWDRPVESAPATETTTTTGER